MLANRISALSSSHIPSRELFENALAWLRANYSKYNFFVERDVVWTIQGHIQEQIYELAVPYQVFNDYPMLPGSQRSLSADLVIRSVEDIVDVAVEFKYEPSHNRTDILKHKFPVVFWGDDGVGKDVKRIHEFVEKGKAKVAYSVFIDEGGYFRKRAPHPLSEWKGWGRGVWVLQSQAETLASKRTGVPETPG